MNVVGAFYDASMSDGHRFTDVFEGTMSPAERAVVSAALDRMEALRASIARDEAELASLLAFLAETAHEQGAQRERAFGDGRAIDYAREAMAAEVAVASRISPGAASREMTDAEALVNEFPHTHALLREGRVTRSHVRAVMAVGDKLDPSTRGLLDQAAADVLPEKTPGQIRRIAERHAAELAPSSLHERHRKARERRGRSMTDLGDGMSELRVVLPTFTAAAVDDLLTKRARIVQKDARRARHEYAQAERHALELGVDLDPALSGDVTLTDRRTIDQIWADLFAASVLSSAPTGHDLHSAGTAADLEGVRATVQVVIPATMMIDPAQGVSWIDGGETVAPDTARHIAGRAAGWERLFTKPDTGEIVHVDHCRPTAEQRRRLIARDVTCRFPGCSTPASACDLDHNQEYARGGPTAVHNLSHLCPRHHRLRHREGWRIRQLDHGVLEFTSPAGRTYTDTPISRVAFTGPDDECADDPGGDVAAA